MRNRPRVALTISYVVICVAAWLALCYGLQHLISAAPNEKPYTEIEVNNTSSIVGVSVEVKCDWQHRTQQYTYWDYVTIRRASKKSLHVPFGLRKCELWGKASW
jgi:hypothetical protein